MNQTELIDMLNSKSRAELVALLQESERALNQVYPAARRLTELTMQQESIQKEMAGGDENAKGGKKLFAILGVVTVIVAIMTFLVFDSGFLHLLAVLGLGFCVLATVVCGCLTIGYNKTWKAAENKLKQVNDQIPNAAKQLAALKTQYQDLLYIRQMVCPQQCVDPKYMRVYVSYFENGRADTLKEAANLLDEFLHRERMEQGMAAQVAAAQAAQAAATQAAVMASQAKSAAEDAAFQAKYR